SILFGCSMETIRQLPIYQSSDDVKGLVNDTHWKKAEEEGKHIEKLYKENKWKYQLMGDETEYNKLDEEISKLQVSLEEKDTKVAKRNIAVIQHFIESIYFR